MRTLIAAIAAATTIASAGPLTPPPGPPASTNKTLDEVEPSTPIESLPGDASALHIISQPGAYHVTGNIDAPGAIDTLIRVNASYVLIDFRGFRINGAAVTDHIVLGNGTYITVRNGSAIFTNDTAIDLPGANNTVEDVRLVGASSLRDFAIRTGDGGQVRDCSLRSSGSVAVGEASIVTRCTFTTQLDSLDLGDGSIATDIAIEGINSVDADRLVSMGDACTLARVTIRNAFNSAVFGGDDCAVYDSTFANADTLGSVGSGTVMRLGDNAHIRNIRIANWGMTGINMGSGIIENAMLRNVTGTAIVADSGRVEGCTILDSGIGVIVERRGIIRSTTIESVDTLGISALEECLVEDCTITGSLGNGIELGFNSEARGNRLRGNFDVGIAATNDALIIGNHLDGDPIVATGADNVIDANVITDVTGGAAITVTGTGNLVIRNRVTGTASAFDINGGNDLGTISSSPAGAGPFDNLAF